MNKLVLLLAILFVSGLSFAQSNLTPEKVEELTTLKTELDGTYQIQMIGTRSLPTIELSWFEVIHDSREQNETVYITVSDNCRIMVLPQTAIDAPGFVPLEYIGYINQ